jgi:hypothetical protein
MCETVCVHPFFGNGGRENFIFGFDDGPGDGAESPKTAWDVGAGDGEDGKGDAQRDEERERTKALAYILMFVVEKLLLGLMFGVGVVVVDDKSYS